MTPPDDSKTYKSYKKVGILTTFCIFIFIEVDKQIYILCNVKSSCQIVLRVLKTEKISF